MKAWWQGLQPRERGMLGVGALVVLSAILYLAVWEPLAESRALYRAQVAERQALAQWLESVGPVAERLREAGRDERTLDGRSLLGVVDASARAAGLAGALSRIEPGAEDQVRVWLEGAEFTVLVGWLHELSARRPVRIEQLEADRTDSPGRINARITIEQAG